MEWLDSSFLVLVFLMVHIIELPWVFCKYFFLPPFDIYFTCIIKKYIFHPSRLCKIFHVCWYVCVLHKGGQLIWVSIIIDQGIPNLLNSTFFRTWFTFNAEVNANTRNLKTFFHSGPQDFIHLRFHDVIFSVDNPGIEWFDLGSTDCTWFL